MRDMGQGPSSNDAGLRMSDLAEPPPATLKSVDEMLAVAHAMEREAAARYAMLADCMCRVDHDRWAGGDAPGGRRHARHRRAAHGAEPHHRCLIQRAGERRVRPRASATSAGYTGLSPLTVTRVPERVWGQ